MAPILLLLAGCAGTPVEEPVAGDAPGSVAGAPVQDPTTPQGVGPQGVGQQREEALVELRAILEAEEGQPYIEDLMFTNFVVQR